MKLKFFIVTFFTFVSLLLLLSIPTQAAEKLLFISTQYQTHQDLEFLSAQSVHPVDTIQSEKLAMPLFLSIVTLQQKDTIEKAGYSIIIIDPDPGELTHYYLLENELKLPFPSNTGFALVFPFTDKLMLVKVPEGKEMEDLRTGDLVRMFIKQYASDMVIPKISQPERNITSPMINTKEGTLKERKGSTTLEIVFLLFVLIAAGGVYLFYRKKRHRELNKSSTLPPTLKE